MKAETKKFTSLTDDAKAILLLCSSLGRKKSSEGDRPYTVTEYGKFAMWLNTIGRRPADLLNSECDQILTDMPAVHHTYLTVRKFVLTSGIPQSISASIRADHPLTPHPASPTSLHSFATRSLSPRHACSCPIYVTLTAFRYTLTPQ